MEGTLAVANPRQALADLPRDAGERRLLDAVRRGDRQAAEELVDRTHGAVFAALFGICRDRDLAADLTQETLLRFAVTARFWAALPVKEIARSEGVSGVAIRKRLRRAFRILGSALNRGHS